MVSHPRHVDPPHDAHVATAPYNFVPLPEAALTAADALGLGGHEIEQHLDVHDTFDRMRFHGEIELEIETLTPTFIRGERRRRKDGWDERQSNQRPEPASLPDGRPFLPGSSVRGMVRSLAEVLAFAKITGASTAEPFYRTVGTDRIGIAYRNRMVASDPEAGFARRTKRGWVVQPVTHVLRVPHSLLTPLGFSYGRPGYRPDRKFHKKRVWVRREVKAHLVEAIQITGSRPDGSGWEQGRLVLTGAAPPSRDDSRGRRSEYVFLDSELGNDIEVPDDVIDRFHSDEQLSQWQQEVYSSRDRERAGALGDGDPVWFLRDEEKRAVRFLGRARLFRLPYDRSLADLLPGEAGTGDIDLVEAVFGAVGVRTGEGQELRSVRGRVRFHDAVPAKQPDGGWLEPELVPSILSSPKPTTYVHYLTQNGRGSARDWTTYLRDDRTTPRGTKFYWHHHERKQVLDRAKAPSDVASGKPKQITKITPVRIGATFAGRIEFENLGLVELGMLLAVVRLPDGCAHRIGMAKPLGFGSVRVTPTLRLMDVSRRYRHWNDDGWHDESVNRDVEAEARQAFEDAVLAHAERTGEPMDGDGVGLQRIARLNELFTLTALDAVTSAERIAQMEVDEFKNRRVLPSARWVAGHEGFSADADRVPSPAPPEKDLDAKRRGAGGGGRPGVRRGTPQRSGGEFRRGPKGPLPKPRLEVTTGTAMAEQTKSGRWRFLLANGKTGVLHPASATPPDVDVGRSYRFEIVAGGIPNVQIRLLPEEAT